MNSDVITAATSNSSLSQSALEKNLIAALTKLQHRAIEKELLDGSVPLAADAKAESFFGFSIGAHHFMVAANCFCEVLMDTAIASIPNAPSCLVGLSNVRGVLIPIYQLHSALELEPPKKSIIFLVGKGDAAVGILIDDLPISLMVSANQRQTVSQEDNSLLQNFIRSELGASYYIVGQRDWLLLNGATLGDQLLAMANQSQKSSAAFSAGRAPAYS